MKRAFKRVRVPLIGVIAIFILVVIAFVTVKPEALTVKRGPPASSITGNVIVDQSLYDAHLSTDLPCTSLEDQVCGTDGKTYRNLCHAIKAGVDARHQGPCAGSWEKIE